MAMHKPPHPGEIILNEFIEPLEISSRYLASKLDVSPSTLNRVLKGSSSVTTEMAIRLSKVLGPSPEFWLNLQNNYDLSVAKKTIKVSHLRRLKLPKAS